MFQPLTDETAVATAFRSLKRRMTDHTEPYEDHAVGYPGGSHRYAVYWDPTCAYWGLYERPDWITRHWICFGVERPSQTSMLNITLEINPPLKGINRRCAGAFLCDESGQVYFAHNGRVGGGYPGVGRSAFRDTYGKGDWQVVHWGGLKLSEMNVLGSIDDQDLPANVGQFVHDVALFKAKVREGQITRGA